MKIILRAGLLLVVAASTLSVVSQPNAKPLRDRGPAAFPRPHFLRTG